MKKEEGNTMQIGFRIQDIDAMEALKSYVERRLRFAMGRFGNRVGQVTVRLSRNGGENECRISAELQPFGRVAVGESDPDLFTAIDRAAGRLGRLFGRELHRMRDARMGHESIRMAA